MISPYLFLMIFVATKENITLAMNLTIFEEENTAKLRAYLLCTYDNKRLLYFSRYNYDSIPR